MSDERDEKAEARLLKVVRERAMLMRYETLTVLRHEAWNDWTDDKPNDAPCGVMWNAIVRVQNERRSNAR